MNNRKLNEQIAKKTGLTLNEVAALQAACIDAMTAEVGDANTVTLTGLGSFELKEKPARKIFNPNTKTMQEVPARYTMAFRPASQLKEKVKNS